MAQAMQSLEAADREAQQPQEEDGFEGKKESGSKQEAYAKPTDKPFPGMAALDKPFVLPPETPIGTSLDLMAGSARMTTTPRVGGGGGAMTGGALPSWSTGGGGGGGGIGGLFAEAAMSGAAAPPPFPKGSPFDKLAERWTAASGMKRGPAYE